MDVMELKKKYNAAIERNKKAEEYLEAHTVEECEIKRKINGRDKEFTTFELFDELVIELSLLALEIESITEMNMTHYEKINGFNI